MNSLTIVYLCVLVISGDDLCNLPFSKRCNRNDPKFVQCWRSVLEDVPQYLPNGIADLGVPPINRWKSSGKYFNKGDTYGIAHQYMEHAGTKNFEVIDFCIDILSANIIILKLRFPHLEHTCTTLANGTILGYELSGAEGCKEADADVTIDYVFRGKRLRENGKEYIDFSNIEITVLGNYTNQKFYNFIVGGPNANEKFDIEAERSVAMFEPLYNECIRTSLGHDIAKSIKNIYRVCSLDNLHPLKPISESFSSALRRSRSPKTDEDETRLLKGHNNFLDLKALEMNTP